MSHWGYFTDFVSLDRNPAAIQQTSGRQFFLHPEISERLAKYYDLRISGTRLDLRFTVLEQFGQRRDQRNDHDGDQYQ